MAGEGLGQPGAGVGGGVAADAGINDPGGITLAVQAFLQQGDPSLFYRDAVGGAETVANNQYDPGWRRIRLDQ